MIHGHLAVLRLKLTRPVLFLAFLRIGNIVIVKKMAYRNGNPEDYYEYYDCVESNNDKKCLLAMQSVDLGSHHDEIDKLGQVSDVWA